VLNQVENTVYSRATRVVYTQEYPLTLPLVGIGQMSRLNADVYLYLQPCQMAASIEW